MALGASEARCSHIDPIVSKSAPSSTPARCAPTASVASPASDARCAMRPTTLPTTASRLGPNPNSASSSRSRGRAIARRAAISTPTERVRGGNVRWRAM